MFRFLAFFCFYNIIYSNLASQYHKLMKSFLSLLSKRREIRDTIKPSGSMWEYNPGRLSQQMCELPKRNSTSIDSWHLVNKLPILHVLGQITISKIRPIGPSFLYFVYELGFLNFEVEKCRSWGCRDLFWQKNSRNCALRFFRFIIFVMLFYLLSFLTF